MYARICASISSSSVITAYRYILSELLMKLISLGSMAIGWYLSAGSHDKTCSNWIEIQGSSFTIFSFPFFIFQSSGLIRKRCVVIVVGIYCAFRPCAVVYFVLAFDYYSKISLKYKKKEKMIYSLVIRIIEWLM